MFENTRVILFDWGGTLAHVSRQQDVWPRGVEAALSFLQRAGIDTPDGAIDTLGAHLLGQLGAANEENDYRETDPRQLLRDWAAAQNVALRDGDFMDKLVDAMWRPWVGCLDPIGPACETLAALRERGYTLGLVSNVATPAHLCVEELQRLRFAPYFDVLVFSSDVGYRKPNKRMYERALATTRHTAGDIQPQQVLFVGDTPDADVDGPQKFGFRTVLLRTGVWDGSEVWLDRRPDLILDTVHELPAALDSAAPRPNG